MTLTNVADVAERQIVRNENVIEYKGASFVEETLVSRSHDV